MLESLVNRARYDFSREFTPTTLNTRHGSCDTITPTIMCTSHLTTSVSSQSLNMKLQWQSRSARSSIHNGLTIGRIQKDQETCEKHMDTCKAGAADWLVHIFQIARMLWFSEIPDPSSSDGGPTTESGTDNFDYGDFHGSKRSA